MADAVISNQSRVSNLANAPESIQRMCAECESEERDTVRLQRQDEEDEEILTKPEGPGSTARSDGAAQSAAAAVESGGTPLPAEARSYFEPRFGRDLSGVRVHTGNRAQHAASAIGARAYTLGRDIAFGAGEFAPQTSRGRHLLAHELAHVMQQDGAGRSDGRTVRRRIAVHRPSSKIPDPDGKGLKQTNAKTIEQYLASLCAAGSFKVNGAGDVGAGGGLCSKEIVGPTEEEETKSGQQRVDTPTGCSCICDLTGSKNLWTIVVSDARTPSTGYTEIAKANTEGSGGSGGALRVPSPNSRKLWGATTRSGVNLNMDPWLVLGHELCGHAWLADQGKRGPDVAKPRGSGGHQVAVGRENLIRQEHRIEARGSYRDPYCGESFFRWKSSPENVHRNEQVMRECRRWRRAYNRKHKTSYTIKDRIPP